MTTISLIQGEDLLQEKTINLHDLFREMGSVLVALSGGIDSTLALKIAHDVLGDQVVAVTATSPTFPEIELEAVHRVSQEIGARLIIVETNQLTLPAFVQNDGTRCYHCKTDLYTLLRKMKEELEASTIVDGTNSDDLGDDRPGMKAARELGVRSPFVEVGMTKHDIRTLAKQLGLSNWDKPAAACLSSRISRGVFITPENLKRVEKAESLLAREGFTQIRVRDHEGVARIELEEKEIPLFLSSARRENIVQHLTSLGFHTVTLDLEGYRQGGGNKGPASITQLFPTT